MFRSCLLALAFLLAPVLLAQEITFYIGTYTKGDSEGIYRARLELKTGAMPGGELVAATESPSWVKLSADGKFLYACNETKTGEVSAFAVTATNLQHLITQPSGGGHPCHLAISPDGKTLVVANYRGGSVASYRIEADGVLSQQVSLSQHPRRGSPPQEKTPRAHHVIFANARMYCCDLGLDEVFEYTVRDGELRRHTGDYKLAPGSGPRQLGVHPDGAHLYVLNQISSDITHFSPSGRQGSVTTLPADWTGRNSTAEIAVHPNGKFVYASNRGDDSIAMFAVEANGSLRALGHEKTGGKTPRNFVLSPDGRFLIAANQNSGDLFSFRVDPASGLLKPTGHSLKVPSPVCIAFAP